MNNSFINFHAITLLNNMTLKIHFDSSQKKYSDNEKEAMHQIHIEIVSTTTGVVEDHKEISDITFEEIPAESSEFFEKIQKQKMKELWDNDEDEVWDDV